jgi:inhibitor of KinA sporulation pathway (predicted exonuclease)
MVQSCLNLDGTRTLIKYDEKRMLNEFDRYIAKKEQPISMAYCTDFAQLVIRGCGQQ